MESSASSKPPTGGDAAKTRRTRKNSDGRAAADPFAVGPGMDDIFGMGLALSPGAAAPTTTGSSNASVPLRRQRGGEGRQPAEGGGSTATATARPGDSLHYGHYLGAYDSDPSTTSSSSASYSSSEHELGQPMYAAPIHRDAAGRVIIADAKSENRNQVGAQRRRRRRKKSDSTAAAGNGNENDDVDANNDGEGRYDYDPDDADALDEKARLLKEELGSYNQGVSDAAGGGPQRMPCEFQAAPIPYWVTKMSDILLFHNGGSGGGGGSSVLPVDAACAQLQSDLVRLRRLRGEVDRGRDWGFMRSRPAHYYEQYGPPVMEEGESAGDVEMRGILGQESSGSGLGSAPANSTGHVAIPIIKSDDDDEGGAEGNADAGNKEKRKKRMPEAPLAVMSPADEAADEARPLLAREIPLWRRRGAAHATLTDLIELLEGRLRLFNRRLADPVEGRWFEMVGAPNATGVDGTTRAVVPPALERSYATMMANTVLSDLFAVPSSLMGFGGDRAARISEAYLRQLPRVHDQFLIEEDFRPRYDYLLARKANMREPVEATVLAGTSTSTTAGQSFFHNSSSFPPEDTRRSFTVHVDYIRVQPPPSQGLLMLRGYDDGNNNGSSSTTFSRLLADTQHYSALLSGDVLEDTLLLANSLTGLNNTRSTNRNTTAVNAATASSAEALRFGPAAAAALSLLSVAIGQKDALVPFTSEAYLVSVLLQHYERYRLLRLNLLPHLKGRGFYEEQLAHLNSQQESGAECTADLAQLQRQLQLLRDKSADVERAALTAMIALWRAVLHLRSSQSESGSGDGQQVREGDTTGGGGGIMPFVVSSRREARAATLAGAETAAAVAVAAATSVPGGALTADPSGGGFAAVAMDRSGGGGHGPSRRNVQDMGLFASDSSDPSLDGTTTTNTNSRTLPSLNAHDGTAMASVLLGQRVVVALARSGRRADRFRFFLRRAGRAAESPYVLGEDVLLYEPVMEGADALPPINGNSAIPSPPSSAAAVPRDCLDRLQFFQVAVFARASAAVSPQYVGCTLPRPLSAAKTVFFNETFEIRVLRDPVEVILHVIHVTDNDSDKNKGAVAATVRLQPTLTRSYLLLPLGAPVSFVFKQRLLSRYGGQPLSGVLSASTTWTTAKGLSVGQIEHLFLSGAADPLSPEYAPLLRLLKGYYTEMERSSQRDKKKNNGGGKGSRGSTGRAGEAGGGGRARSAADRRGRRSGSVFGDLHSPTFASATDSGGGGRRRSFSTGAAAAIAARSPTSAALAAAATAQRRRSFSPSALREMPLVAGDGHTAATATAVALGSPAAWQPMSSGLAAAAATPLTDRQLLIKHRWLIAVGQSKAMDQVEAALLRCPIPLYDWEQYALLKSVRRGLERDLKERRGRMGLLGNGNGDGDDDENGSRRGHTGGGPRDGLFDERAYHAEPTSVSGLALSPLPRDTKLRLWQDRQRHMKLTRRPVRHLSDAERLEQVVVIPTFSIKLVFDLAPRSQLNPRRVARPKTQDIDRELLRRQRDSRIMVHVMKANALPGRADGTPLEPFVQASFVYDNAYSRCEVGSSPSWFQSLELPFQPLDFEEDTLSMIDDDIVISVYDKVEIPMPAATTTAGAVAHETHYRTERRLLGTLRLPFYSLHQAAEARMEGVYPLNTPRWLLGYDGGGTTTGADVNAGPAGNHHQGNVAAAGNPLSEDAPHATTAATAAAAAASSSRAAAASAGPTIQLYISLWPPLQREKPAQESLAEVTRKVRQLAGSVELAYLHEAALRWQRTATGRIKSITAINAQASERAVEAFVNCSTGDLVLACRYLLPRGGPPPPRTVTNIFEAVRFVSLLPFVVDIMTWGDKDVWSTNVELLAMRSGDYEELALLLAHFLRHLAPTRATYIVVGQGEIYAQSIFVLHYFEDTSNSDSGGGAHARHHHNDTTPTTPVSGQWRLIDPRTGWITPVERPFGSILRDVHYVVSDAQLWANVQLSGLPHRMSWDLHDAASWLPCFDTRKDRRLAGCMPFITSIQREHLTFRPVDPLAAKEIEVDLRAALRRALLAWRNHRPPAFHRGVEAILRDLLVVAEDEECACGSARHPAVTAMARERLAEYYGTAVDGVTFAPAPPQQSKKDRKKEESRAGHAAAATRAVADAVSVMNEPATERELMLLPPTAGSSSTNNRTGSRHGSASSTRRQRPRLRLVGAPVASPHSGSDRRFNKILQQVFECAAHEVGTDDVSFAAGVYVKSYTGDVHAMWVFLVAICRGVEEVVEVEEAAGAGGSREDEAARA